MLILSASQVGPTGERSQSLRVARLLAERLGARFPGTEVADLRQFALGTCDMCEACAGDGLCPRDPAFNALHSLWARHREAVLVCPHYAGIPSRLLGFFEKVQETGYLAYCQGRPGPEPKTVAVVAHGGLTEDYEVLYTQNLLTPLGNLLKSSGHRVLNDGIGVPLCFGVKAYGTEPEAGSVCFRKEDDAEAAERVVGLVAEAFRKTLSGP